MKIFLALTAGLVIWIVLWAFGIKGFDAFFVPLTFILIAVLAELVTKTLPGNQEP